MLPVPGMLSIVCEGAFLAVIVRWLLQLDMTISWAALIGALSRMLGAWVVQFFDPAITLHSISDFAISAFVLVVLLGFAQHVRAH